MERKRSDRAREFRPKAFWVNIGYDGDRIEREAKAGHIDDNDPMLGVQYRIGVAGDVDEKLVSVSMRRNVFLIAL